MEHQRVLRLLDRGVNVEHPRVARIVRDAMGELEQVADEELNGWPDVKKRCFLVACKLNVTLALEKMKRHASWSRRTLPVALTVGIRAELAKGKLEVTDYVDLERGSPILVVRSKRFDPRIRNLDDSVSATLIVLEQMLRKSSSGQICLYYDRSEFCQHTNWDIEYLQTIIGVLSANYPESLSCVYIYPTDGPIGMLWPLVRASMDERTASKVVMPATVDELLDAIPSALLPKLLH